MALCGFGPGPAPLSFALDCSMQPRRLRVLLIMDTVLSPIAALYCFEGILAAGSLFTGERAQSNFELWGLLFLVCMFFLSASE